VEQLEPAPVGRLGGTGWVAGVQWCRLARLVELEGREREVVKKF
jgi:hypothetical protein